MNRSLTALATVPLLTPPATLTPPAGLTRLRQPVTGGLPCTLRLDGTVRAVLAIPAGEARPWLDADPTTPVAASDPELAPVDGNATGADTIAATPPRPRLYLVAGGAVVASVPLVAGSRRRLPDDGDAAGGALIEIMILGWDLRAGNLRGAGDYGGFIDLAWRRCDTASDTFELPPVPPSLRARQTPARRFESELGAGGDAGGGDPQP